MNECKCLNCVNVIAWDTQMKMGKGNVGIQYRRMTEYLYLDCVNVNVNDRVGL